MEKYVVARLLILLLNVGTLLTSLASSPVYCAPPPHHSVKPPFPPKHPPNVKPPFYPKPPVVKPPPPYLPKPPVVTPPYVPNPPVVTPPHVPTPPPYVPKPPIVTPPYVPTPPPYVPKPPIVSPPPYVPIPPVVTPSPPPHVPKSPVVTPCPPPPPPPTPCPPPPPPKVTPSPVQQKSCPIDTLKLGACVDVLGGLVHAVVGESAKQTCCPVLHGLVDLDAAVCLCTTIKAKLLNINIIIPVALEVLVGCGKSIPPGFQCPA